MTNSEVALKYAPDVFQLIRSDKDRITPIYFGDYIKADLPPTCYYEVENYGNDFIVAYHYFHRYSTGVKIPFIGAVGSHPFDWEGVVKFIREDGTVEFTATRWHYDLRFWRGSCNLVSISSGGHSIVPIKTLGYKVDFLGSEIYPAQDFQYHNIMNHYKLFYERIYPIFRQYGVDTWRDWNDSRLARKFSISRTAGLIHKDPMKLFRYALKAGVVENV